MSLELSNQQFVLNQEFWRKPIEKTNRMYSKMCKKAICSIRKSMIYIQKNREFDPGSGLTLAVHIRHASRTEVVINGVKIYRNKVSNNDFSGGLVSNT